MEAGQLSLCCSFSISESGSVIMCFLLILRGFLFCTWLGWGGTLELCEFQLEAQPTNTSWHLITSFHHECEEGSKKNKKNRGSNQALVLGQVAKTCVGRMAAATGGFSVTDMGFRGRGGLAEILEHEGQRSKLFSSSFPSLTSHRFDIFYCDDGRWMS